MRELGSLVLVYLLAWGFLVLRYEVDYSPAVRLFETLDARPESAPAIPDRGQEEPSDAREGLPV